MFLFYRTTRLNKTTVCCPISTSTPTVSRPGSSTPGASNNAAATGYYFLAVDLKQKMQR